MFFQAWGFQRIRIEAAVHTITKRRQALGARDSYPLFGSAELCFQLDELRATRNVGSPKLLKPRINWYAQHEVGRGYRLCEIVADEHPQRASTNNLVSARAFQFVAARDRLQLRTREINWSNLAATYEQ